MHRRAVLIGIATALVASCTALPPGAMAPNSVLIVTRHGDRDGDDLSQAGRDRALALVVALEGMPVDGIYSPGIQRNLDTAAPLAQARGLPVQRRPQERPLEALVPEGAGRTLVWIGNKGNIAEIWEGLNLPEPAPLDYGDLHIIRSDAKGSVTVERRRYGA